MLVGATRSNGDITKNANRANLTDRAGWEKSIKEARTSKSRGNSFQYTRAPREGLTLNADGICRIASRGEFDCQHVVPIASQVS